MTGVCWSISFPRSIMVCYCPLSVLSVPESILNEGQLHLAAIFHLSLCYHGDTLVFLMNLAASRGVHAHEGEAGAPQSSGSKGPRQTVEGHKQGEGRSLVPKHHRDSHFKNPLNMQRGPQPNIKTLFWLSQILAIAPSSVCPFPFPTPSVP